jgi:hypothetical protein
MNVSDEVQSKKKKKKKKKNKKTRYVREKRESACVHVVPSVFPFRGLDLFCFLLFQLVTLLSFHFLSFSNSMHRMYPFFLSQSVTPLLFTLLPCFSFYFPCEAPFLCQGSFYFLGLSCGRKKKKKKERDTNPAIKKNFGRFVSISLCGLTFSPAGGA